MRIKMRKRLNLTIDKDLYILLKKKQSNVSRLVEKLLFKYYMPIISAFRAEDVGSNPARGIYNYLLGT